MNSADYLLRIYRLSVDFGSGNATGRVAMNGFIQLSDPDRKLPFPIMRDAAPDRWLTGADLDPESMVRMPDATFWVGDEFGPFLLHFAADGRLLEPPYEVPVMRSPDHPHAQAPDAGADQHGHVRRSRGFEGLALFGTDLYVVLESGMGADADAALIYEFNLEKRAFTGLRWRLRLPAMTRHHRIRLGRSRRRDCAARFLAIERDGGHGPAAQLKRVHEVHLAGTSVVSARHRESAGHRQPPASWRPSRPLHLSVHHDRSRLGDNTRRLLLANDNNYPAGGGREGAVRDATEFIRLQLNSPLCD